MIFSFCCAINADNAKAMYDLGYTGTESTVFCINDLDDAAFAEFLAKTKEYKLNYVSANGMFPASVPLLQGEAGYAKVTEYLERVFPRIVALGIPVVVLGSGGARKIPEGMSKEEATDRFCALLTDVISPMAAKYGITIAIEELRKEECNFINSCKEAMEIIRRVNLPNIKLLVDYYHAILGGDTLEELATYGDNIVHVHIASPKNKRYIPLESDYEDCVAFFRMLKSIGYKGAISFEGNVNPGDEKVGFDVMSRAMAEA